MKNIKVKVDGMNCNHCKIRVENNLQQITGVQTVIADIMSGEVIIKGDDFEFEQVQKKVEEAGYTFGGKLA
jgi:copper chaperone CopZ